jgi:hypothetical protein
MRRLLGKPNITDSAVRGSGVADRRTHHGAWERAMVNRWDSSAF